MSTISKLTTSFIKISSALGKVKNQDEYNMYYRCWTKRRWSA